MLTFLAIIYGIASLLLVIIVLVQAGKGAGMGIFGSGASNTTFGAQSGDILTRITTLLGIIFFGVALIIAFKVSSDDTVSASREFKTPATTRKSVPFAPGTTPVKQTNKKMKPGITNPAIGTNKKASKNTKTK